MASSTYTNNDETVTVPPAVAADGTTPPSPNTKKWWNERFETFRGDLANEIVLQPAGQPFLRMNKRGPQKTRLVSMCGGHPIIIDITVKKGGCKRFVGSLESRSGQARTSLPSATRLLTMLIQTHQPSEFELAR